MGWQRTKMFDIEKLCILQIVGLNHFLVTMYLPTVDKVMMMIMSGWVIRHPRVK